MNIHAEADALIHEASVTEVTVQLMIRMAAIVDEAYPVINKAIWSQGVYSMFTHCIEHV